MNSEELTNMCAYLYIKVMFFLFFFFFAKQDNAFSTVFSVALHYLEGYTVTSVLHFSDGACLICSIIMYADR